MTQTTLFFLQYWSKPDNNGRNKRISDANYSSCNNISTGSSCLPLDYKTGISHQNPEKTLFDYARHRIFQLSKDRFRKFATLRILYYSNSVATFNVSLACGDIETNPGPENLSCSINQSTLNSPSDYDICCTSNDYNVCFSYLVTLHYSFGLLCDTCNVCLHYTCVGVSFDKFIEIYAHIAHPLKAKLAYSLSLMNIPWMMMPQAIVPLLILGSMLRISLNYLEHRFLSSLTRVYPLRVSLLVI